MAAGCRRIVTDVLNEIEIFFQLFKVAYLVECPERIIGIAEPRSDSPVAGAVVKFRQLVLPEAMIRLYPHTGAV